MFSSLISCPLPVSGSIPLSSTPAHSFPGRSNFPSSTSGADITMLRKHLFLLQSLFIVFTLTILYCARYQYFGSGFPSLHLPGGLVSGKVDDETPENGMYIMQIGSVEQHADHHDPGILSRENVTTYVNSIMDPQSKLLPRLECPQADLFRYDGLKSTPSSSSAASSRIRYLFALDLRECLPLLPRLIGSVVEAIRFLGPEACALSIVEGNSPDGTGEVLAALKTELDALTTTYYFKHSDIDPAGGGDRIAKLAALRNLALQPLRGTGSKEIYAPDTTVIFLNDVAICPDDILELIHQRVYLGADMTCAMDWTYAGNDPTFYDVWIARGMTGDSFFEIPPDGNWNSAWNLFWNDADTQARYRNHQPFQVFSCWNGAAVFSAAPVLERKVAFRGPREGECYQGEPQLFCKDLWFNGYGKIAVVPSVNLEYSDERGGRLKEAKGYASQWVGSGGEASRDDAIEWRLEPPDSVKCMATYDNQYFEPWNATQFE